MIEFRSEPLDPMLSDAAALFELHYQELTLHKESVKLNPMLENYRQIERAGKIAVYTARDDGELVGYGVFFVAPHIHYGDTIVAMNDVLFLHPAHRKGSMGTRLIKFCEQQLRARGAHKIAWHIKLSLDWSPILIRLGYVTEEITVGKLL